MIVRIKRRFRAFPVNEIPRHRLRNLAGIVACAG
jgi:hypothetical protein